MLDKLRTRLKSDLQREAELDQQSIENFARTRRAALAIAAAHRAQRELSAPVISDDGKVIDITPRINYDHSDEPSQALLDLVSREPSHVTILEPKQLDQISATPRN